MTNYNIRFIKDMEKLSYHVTDSARYPKPNGWKELNTYRYKKSGLYAKSYINTSGKKVLVYAGTQSLAGFNEVRKDIGADAKLAIKRIPAQAEDAYQVYKKFIDNNGDKDTIVVGYSLGGSLAQIICNETGAHGITFASYGVGDNIKPKYPNNIINFGSEGDPIFTLKKDKHIGEVYLIPDESSLVYKGTSINKHMPNKIGDVSKAIKYENKYQQARDNSYVLDRYINRNYYDNSLFDVSNRVIYDTDGKKIEDMNKEEIEQFWEQYYDNGEKFPSKEDMERRVRFGELIYVENYTRSDGTKVSGYYRRYPKN